MSKVKKVLLFLLALVAVFAAKLAMVHVDMNSPIYPKVKVKFQKQAIEFLVNPLLDNKELRYQLRLARQEKKALDEIVAAFRVAPVKNKAVIEKAVDDYIEVFNRLDGIKHVVDRYVVEYSEVRTAHWRAERMAKQDKVEIAKLDSLMRLVDSHYHSKIYSGTGFDELDRMNIAGTNMTHRIMYVEKSAIYGNPSKFAFRRVVREMFESVARHKRTSRPLK